MTTRGPPHTHAEPALFESTSQPQYGPPPYHGSSYLVHALWGAVGVASLSTILVWALAQPRRGVALLVVSGILTSLILTSTMTRMSRTPTIQGGTRDPLDLPLAAAVLLAASIIFAGIDTNVGAIAFATAVGSITLVLSILWCYRGRLQKLWSRMHTNAVPTIHTRRALD